MCLVVYKTRDKIYTFDTNATKKIGVIERNQVVTEECKSFYELPEINTKRWVVAAPDGLYTHLGK